ncbi:MAG: DUF547 domain-containing protein [Alphaproteobacteria bacterium]|nr:DUF547 domain-containing protein [Alphaproteobacteria bacterium]
MLFHLTSPALSGRSLRALGAGVVAVVAMVGAGAGHAAPDAELWDRWLAHDPQSSARVDHGAWSRLLATHVRADADRIHRFDYGAVSESDRTQLRIYLDSLSMTPIGLLRRTEQLAFWINLYNALTVDLVIDHFPVPSIRDIDLSSGLFSDGPWRRKLAVVDGAPLSLDDIEHRILRPIWSDPRVHYAVNCAALGCPDLAREAYTGATVEAMLEAAAARFVNHRRGVSISSDGLVLSSLYDWYAEDFGADDRAVIDHLIRYADTDLAAALGQFDAIEGYRYDWRLNRVD